MSATKQTDPKRKDYGLLTRAETVEWLNCSLRHLHDLVVHGNLPYVRLGKSIRFIPADVLEYVNSHRVGGNGG